MTCKKSCNATLLPPLSRGFFHIQGDTTGFNAGNEGKPSTSRATRLVVAQSLSISGVESCEVTLNITGKKFLLPRFPVET